MLRHNKSQEKKEKEKLNRHACKRKIHTEKERERERRKKRSEINVLRRRTREKRDLVFGEKVGLKRYRDSLIFQFLFYIQKKKRERENKIRRLNEYV